VLLPPSAVVQKRRHASRCVLGAGGVVKERIFTNGCIVATVDVAKERPKAAGRVA
jgi:hypothetical protein